MGRMRRVKKTLWLRLVPELTTTLPLQAARMHAFNNNNPQLTPDSLVLLVTMSQDGVEDQDIHQCA